MTAPQRPLAFVGIGVLVGAAGAFALLRSPAGAGSGDSSAPPAVLSSPAPSLSDRALAEVEASPALADALALPTPFARDLALHRLAADADPSTLVQTIHAMAGRGQTAGGRSAAVGIFLQRLVDIDPERALSLATQATPADRDYFLRVVFGSWSEANLEASLNAVHRLTTTHQQQVAGDAILYTWGGLAPERVDEIIAALPAAYRDKGARARLLAREVAEDPMAALEAALAEAAPVDRWKRVASVAGLWAESDPEAAFASAEMITDANARLAFERAVVDRWALRDPAGAVAWISQMRPSSERGRWLLKGLKSLASVDANRALQWARELESTQGHSGYTRAVLSGVADYDATLAVASLDQLSGTRARVQVIPELAVALARQAPDQVLAWVDGLGNHAERKAAYSAAINAISFANPEEALRLLDSGPDGALRDDALHSTITRLADQHPEQAAAFLTRLAPSAQQFDAALQQLASKWARSEPYAALAWAQSLPEVQQRKALPSVLGTLAQHDVLAATDMVATLSGKARGDALRQVALRYAQQQPAQAMAWLGRFEGEAGYFTSVQSVAMAWLQNDPRAAVSAVSSRLEGDQLSNVVPNLMSQWTRQDPAAASAWVDQLPSEIQAQSAQHVVSEWARRDPSSAVRWAADFDGPTRDQVLSMALSNSVSTNPAFAAEGLRWVDDIADAAAREQAAFRIVYGLAQHDVREARAALDRVALSPGHVAQINHYIERQE
ncbi:MAG: hypothetical protein AAFX85_01015 [Pseudomonadota bacterium]